MANRKWINRLGQVFHRDEQGMAMVMALIALALGTLMITPTLNHMVAGIKSVDIKERRTGEFYAADAGIEYAVWTVKNDPLATYPYSDQIVDVNGDNVSITIENVVDRTFKITSTAGGTTIESYTSVDYEYYDGDQDWGQNTYISVNAWISGSLDLGQWSVIEGSLYIEGDFDGSQADRIEGDVYATGNVDLSQSLTVWGTVYSGGDIKLTQNVIVQGDVYALGIIDISQGCRIEGSAYAGGTISTDYSSDIWGSAVEGYAGPWPGLPSWVIEYPKITSYQIN
ncbi:MAG: hypothetical protein JSW16_01565 [Dehalococcoidales bacterium]|nr:MAG: hypothetical protein JSW16_01565 [Dehalococcoidales bacterium]